MDTDTLSTPSKVSLPPDDGVADGERTPGSSLPKGEELADLAALTGVEPEALQRSLQSAKAAADKRRMSPLVSPSQSEGRELVPPLGAKRQLLEEMTELVSTQKTAGVTDLLPEAPTIEQVIPSRSIDEAITSTPVSSVTEGLKGEGIDTAESFKAEIAPIVEKLPEEASILVAQNDTDSAGKEAVGVSEVALASKDAAPVGETVGEALQQLEETKGEPAPEGVSSDHPVLGSLSTQAAAYVMKTLAVDNSGATYEANSPLNEQAESVPAGEVVTSKVTPVVEADGENPVEQKELPAVVPVELTPAEAAADAPSVTLIPSVETSPEAAPEAPAGEIPEAVSAPDAVVDLAAVSSEEVKDLHEVVEKEIPSVLADSPAAIPSSATEALPGAEIGELKERAETAGLEVPTLDDFIAMKPETIASGLAQPTADVSQAAEEAVEHSASAPTALEPPLAVLPVPVHTGPTDTTESQVVVPAGENEVKAPEEPSAELPVLVESVPELPASEETKALDPAETPSVAELIPGLITPGPGAYNRAAKEAAVDAAAKTEPEAANPAVVPPVTPGDISEAPVASKPTLPAVAPKKSGGLFSCCFSPTVSE